MKLCQIMRVPTDFVDVERDSDSSEERENALDDSDLCLEDLDSEELRALDDEDADGDGSFVGDEDEIENGNDARKKDNELL